MAAPVEPCPSLLAQARVSRRSQALSEGASLLAAKEISPVETEPADTYHTWSMMLEESCRCSGGLEPEWKAPFDSAMMEHQLPLSVTNDVTSPRAQSRPVQFSFTELRPLGRNSLRSANFHCSVFGGFALCIETRLQEERNRASRRVSDNMNEDRLV